MGDAVLTAQLGHRRRIRGVYLRREEPVVVRCRLRGPRRVVVGDDDGLEEVATSGNRCERRSHSAGADQQYPHPLLPPRSSVLPVRCWNARPCRRGTTPGRSRSRFGLTMRWRDGPASVVVATWPAMRTSTVAMPWLYSPM